ncbi:DUF2620 domain-containing protein [Escherichia coli]|uniref:DUF2620 domain-containing protein n=1 Tax=Escherichia coli TaxID=562 RepID=UPI001D5F3D1B|nr:DUF2620 domain-containing protein [Escherichia coli]EGM5976174.1 DUF2620 domain-containing protein [Escherichia coli]ELM9041044.1 DUF2620 domain-containing protein [Escherichia coli]
MKFVIGGQIEKEKIAETVRREAGEHVDSLTVMGDIEAAMAIKSGAADYYFGACNTGGGALAMAIAILGASQCITVGMPGKILSNEEIIAEVKAGKKAFGFTGQDIDVVVPIILKAILGL